MIDSHFRAPYQRLLVDPVAKRVRHLSPLTLTLFGCLLGIAIAPLLLFHLSYAAFACLLASGYLDTLDGTVARMRGKTSPVGAVFDIVSDRAVESAVIIGLFLYAPQMRGLPALLMLASTLLCITSFLVVGIFTENQSEKSFHYSPGLIERSEAFALFAAMILFPTLFTPIAWTFAILVSLTAAIRLQQFAGNCREIHLTSKR